MNFKNWLENDLAKQFAFETHLLKTLFPTMISQFHDLTFNYVEKEKTLLMSCPVAPTPLDLNIVLREAKKIFGNDRVIHGFYKANYGGKEAVGFNPAQRIPYPRQVEIGDISTGYWECEAYLVNVERETPQIMKIVSDFYQKTKRLGDILEPMFEY